MTTAPSIRWIGILSVIVLGLVTQTTLAQGTSATFPDPMSFDEMTKLLEPLFYGLPRHECGRRLVAERLQTTETIQ